MSSTQRVLGSIVSLWRYPVKSMMGEGLNTAEVNGGGLLGDRAYAVVDTVDGQAQRTRKNGHSCSSSAPRSLMPRGLV